MSNDLPLRIPTQLSVEPDAAFASQAGLDAGTLKVVSRPQRRGSIELVGAPDMILEVISDSSVGKDRRVLKTAYWEAGVKEFWLVDVRDKRFDFQVLTREAKGYEPTGARDGWSKSPVFNKEFRLSRGRVLLGYPTFKLEMR